MLSGVVTAIVKPLNFTTSCSGRSRHSLLRRDSLDLEARIATSGCGRSELINRRLFLKFHHPSAAASVAVYDITDVGLSRLHCLVLSPSIRARVRKGTKVHEDTHMQRPSTRWWMRSLINDYSWCYQGRAMEEFESQLLRIMVEKGLTLRQMVAIFRVWLSLGY